MKEVRISVSASAKAVDHVVFVSKDGGHLPKGIKKEEFQGEKGSTLLLHSDKGRTLYVGVGEKEKIEIDIVRRAAGVAIKQFLKIGAEVLAIELGEWNEYAQAIVEGALLASYRFEDFKLPASRRKNALKELQLVTTASHFVAVKKAAFVGQILAESTNYTRSIGNQPPNELTPAALADEAKALAKDVRLKVTILDEKKLKAGKFGGILAVGQGSAAAPRLIVLEYWGGSAKTKPVALIGKAITFDTGGISLKPGASMDEMKFDKMGGCAVLGAMQAIARLKLPINVVAVVASAENMPSDRAYRPGDIITMYGGKTVEILNTDAEGRLVLADAITFVREKYQPRSLVDFATLTGACVVALGANRAGFFTDSVTLRDSLNKAGKETGDLVWELPLGEEYDAEMKSDVAVVKNAGSRWGGACTAAAFLKVFVEETPWAHLDIAGTAWITSDKPHLEKGATGYGVRLIVEALRAQH